MHWLWVEPRSIAAPVVVAAKLQATNLQQYTAGLYEVMGEDALLCIPVGVGRRTAALIVAAGTALLVVVVYWALPVTGVQKLVIYSLRRYKYPGGGNSAPPCVLLH